MSNDFVPERSIEISVDLTKLLGFQQIADRIEEADVGQAIDDVHNKIGVPPGEGDVG